MHNNEQIQTLATFMNRWEAANAKLNEGREYPVYELHPGRLHELVDDFTYEQKQYIESTLCVKVM